MVAVRELALEGGVQAQQQSHGIGPEVVTANRMDGVSPFPVVAANLLVGVNDVFL